jgi:hypothetical protein
VSRRSPGELPITRRGGGSTTRELSNRRARTIPRAFGSPRTDFETRGPTWGHARARVSSATQSKYANVRSSTFPGGDEPVDDDAEARFRARPLARDAALDRERPQVQRVLKHPEPRPRVAHASRDALAVERDEKRRHRRGARGFRRVRRGGLFIFVLFVARHRRRLRAPRLRVPAPPRRDVQVRVVQDALEVLEVQPGDAGGERHRQDPRVRRGEVHHLVDELAV